MVEPRPDVELRIPADSAYLSVLRTATAGLAARLDFTLDDIEDLRIAVGEACALVLEGADPDGSLRASYVLDEDELTVQIAADSTNAVEPDRESFAWQVLSALCTRLEAERTERGPAVSLTVGSKVSD